MHAARLQRPDGRRGRPLMRRRLSALVVMLASVAAFGGTDEVPPVARRAVPEEARFSLEPEKARYVLGETILLHFAIANRGGEPFDVDFGGGIEWINATGPEPRYSVRVTAADGAKVPPVGPYGGPRARHRLHGGSVLGDRHDIEPGGATIESLQLFRFVRIDRPGVYRVRVGHDFGWDVTARPDGAPGAEATVTIAEPTAADARRAVADAVAFDAKRFPKRWNPDTGSGDGWRGKAVPWPEFTEMRHPAYVNPLAEAAADGHLPAVDGLMVIETPQATRALMRLIDHEHNAVASAALYALQERLPVFPRSYVISGPGPAFKKAERAWWTRMVRKAWRPQFGTELREWSMAAMVNESANRRAIAAELLTALGEAADLEAVLRAADKELERPAGADPPSGRPGTVWSPGLWAAAEAIVRRGAPLPDRARTPAEIMVDLHVRFGYRDRRPADWEEQLAAWLTHENRHVRALAAGTVRKPVPARIAPLVPKLLDDEDPEVRKNAERLRD